MLFFQVMLLAGYAYSWLITARLSPRAQGFVHAALVLASLVQQPHLEAIRSTAGNPAWSILTVLLSSIGLRYFVLATTSPLLQAWLAGSEAAAFPYWLFALSNGASLIALLSYPVAIEPSLTESAQLHWWGIVYLIFAGMAVAASIKRCLSAGIAVRQATEVSGRPLLWIALAACGSALWMAVANHLSQEVAPVPFLWVLPLSIYLLSFILCFEKSGFEGSGWYRPWLFRWLLPIAWFGSAYRIANQGTSGLAAEIATFSIALFILCMFCHGEIARTKPEDPNGATFFYLTIAFGGAVGALFVGVAAPNLLSTYLELPISIAVSALLALYLLYGIRSSARLIRLAVVTLAAFVISSRFQAGAGEVVHLRNFYGALQVTDSIEGGIAIRRLYNGKTQHGIEFLAADQLHQPTAYYGPHSGIGTLMLTPHEGGRRVGLVGLGAGTLAAYGRPGDTFRFYELNPAVIDVASHDFHFLDGSAAKISVQEGDGRLLLEHEPADSLDILVLDAFSDDSIPVHLLTKEAFQLYFRVLHSDGTLAIHLTNRYLNLQPVVAAAASSVSKAVIDVQSEDDPAQQVLAANWTLVSGRSAEPTRRVSAWTDDYSNLFQILK